MPTIGRSVLHVHDLDAAADFYQRAFGFEILFDREIRPGFRSLHVGPGATSDPGIWLFPVAEVAVVDEPRLVLYSADIDADARLVEAAGARSVIPLTGEPGERFLQVRDPSGNLLVLAEDPRVRGVTGATEAG